MNVIEAHQASKLYKIASRKDTAPNLNETLLKALQEPFRRAQALFSNTAPTDADTDFWALRDVSFEVGQGETFGIIGINGSGKSTLMKIIGNVVRPTTGYVRTRGRIGTLLEVSAGFHPELTGRENTYLKGTAMGMSSGEISGRFDEIVAFAELDQFIDTPIKRYSSGMQMRLGFSIAAKMRPEILLIDEAFAVGDGAFQEKCLDEIELIIQEGSTVLVVSHIMTHITRLCQRVLWLHQGQTMLLDDVQTVTHRYIHRLMSPSDTSMPDLAHLARYQALPDPKKVMSTTEVTLLNPQGISTNQLEMTEPFRIRVKYRVQESEIGQLHIQIRSYDEGGRVLWVGDGDLDLQRRSARKIGDYEAELEIPAWTLNEGRYSLSLGLEIPYKVSHEWLEGILDFNMVDNLNPWKAWYDGRAKPASTALPLRWKYLSEEPV